MKFIVDRSTFDRAIKKVLLATGKKHRVQILTHVAMKVNEDGLLLEGTDLDLGIKIMVPAEVIEEGTTTISGEKLRNICCYSEGEITFSATGSRVLVKTSNSKYSLTGMEYTDFPLLPEVEGKSIIIEQSVLKNSINKVRHAAARSDFRPSLCGISLEIMDASISVAATDGNRLSVVDYPLDFAVEETSIIIPQKNIGSIVELMSGKSDDVKITFGRNKIKFQIKDGEVTSSLIDGKFPNFRHLIPNSSKMNFEIDRDIFITSIKKTMFVDDNSVKSVSISLSDNNVLITSDRNGETAEDSVEISYKGDPIKASYNASFLLDALQSVSDNLIGIHLNSNKEGMLITSENDMHNQLVMPQFL